MRFLSRSTLVAFLTLTACAPTDGGFDPSRDTTETGAAQITSTTAPYKLVDNVVVLDGESAEATRVEADAVVLPAAGAARYKIKAGDYVVSDQGDGFLRKVLRAESDDGGNLRLTTRVAELTEIVIHGSVHAKLALDPLALDLSDDVTLGAEADGLSVTALAVSVTPTITLDLEIRENEVQTFAVSMRLERATELGADLTPTQSLPISTGDIALWKSPKWKFAQKIGPIPLVEVVQIGVYAGLTGTIKIPGRASVRASCSRQHTYSLSYDNGAWSHDQTGGGGCEAAEPTLGAAPFDGDAMIYLKGAVSVDFYGVAGPYLALRDGLRADARNCPAPGELALSSPASVNIGANIFGKKIEKPIVQHVFDIKRWPLDTTSVCH